MLIGAEARCYGEQKRIVVIQIIRHRKRQKNLFVIYLKQGAILGTYPGMGRKLFKDRSMSIYYC